MCLLYLSGFLEVGVLWEYFGFFVSEFWDLFEFLREEGFVGEVNGCILLIFYVELCFMVLLDGLLCFMKIVEW